MARFGRPGRNRGRAGIAALVLSVLVGLWLLGHPAAAQTPPASANPAATPGAPSAPPAAPPAAPTPPATPPAAQPPATPATPPAAAQAPAATPTTPPPAQAAVPPTPQAADPFGEELTLTAKTVIMVKGNGDWDDAFDTITDSIKTLTAFLDKQGIKPSGPPLIVYTSTDDNGFTYQAEFPVDEAPKSLPKDITVGKSPEGKALKFVHRGSYDNMDNTYEAITNHLDDKKLEAKDMFIEEYTTDPLKTAEDKLVINVFVPLK